MESIVPVVVTSSGKIDVKLDDSMTAKELKEYVMAVWNIDKEQIDQPFVVISDMLSNDSFVCDDDMVVGPKLRENSMVRVVLPLKLKD
jgi:hypothetical protein